MPVLTGLNYFTRNVSQDLVKGCDFYFAWFLQQGVMTLWNCVIVLTRVLEKDRRLWKLCRACDTEAFPPQNRWLFWGKLIGLFPTIPSAGKYYSGKILKFLIFILSTKFWHLEIKLLLKISFSIFHWDFKWWLVYLKCCPSH